MVFFLEPASIIETAGNLLMKMRMKEILVGKEQICSFGFFCVWFSLCVCAFNLDKVTKRFSCAGGIISELSLLLLLWASMLFLGITSSLSSVSILFLHRKKIIVIVFLGWSTMIHNREFEKMLIGSCLTPQNSLNLQVRKC